MVEKEPVLLRPPPSLLNLFLRMPAIDAASWQSLGVVSRWVVMTRAAVLVMTVCAALIGILLAASIGNVSPVSALLVVVGLTAAHATNNLLNDWIDWRQGLDRGDYFRARYGTHVLDQGLVNQRVFAGYVLATASVALACGGFLAISEGASVLVLMAIGAVLVIFYTWPLKRIGAGEFAVLAVWGPLMIGGTAHVLTGTLSAFVLLISLVFGIAPTLLILGKHIDKAEQDQARQVSTLPVLVGEVRARTLSVVLLGVQWGLLLALGILDSDGLWLVLCVGSAPAGWRLATLLMSRRPTDRPAGYPESVWPLWFAARAFEYTRSFGLLMTLAIGLRLL